MDQNPQRSEEHNLSEKQGNTDETKVSTAIAAVVDPDFPLPTLTDKTSTLRYVLSFGMLIILLGSGVTGAWLMGTEVLQTEQPILVLGGAVVLILGAMLFTGAAWIDWFELVLGYWWLSIPIGAFAGLIFVFNQEASATLAETD